MSLQAAEIAELKRLLEELEATPEDQRDALIAQVGQQSPALAAELSSLAEALSAPTGGTAGSAQVVRAALNNSPLEHAQLVGPWRILGELGRGGMGVVYSAERADGSFARRAAIKVLPPVFATDRLRARFAAETANLARMDHPHIARLLDAGSTPEGIAYIVMEAVDGVPITQWSLEKTSSVRERLELILALCEAVAYAHTQLLVHRDLKPANVLVTAAGEVKLLDFGISRLIDAEGSNATVDGQAFTPAYASPEQVAGGFVTTATDVFSLGILLYELLTTVNPFKRDAAGATASGSSLSIMRAVAEFEPKPPSTFAKQLDADLDAITLTALAKNPQARYRSVDALATDLRRYLDGFVVSARVPSPLHRARKFVARNALAVGLSALAVGGTAAGVYTTVQARLRAEARSLELLKVSQSIVFKYSAGILYLAGALPVRKQMLSDASIQLDALARDSGDDPATLTALAGSYRQLGEALFFTSGVANVGDRAGGDAAREKGLALARSSLERRPRDVDTLRVAAGLESDMGHILASEGMLAATQMLKLYPGD